MSSACLGRKPADILAEPVRGLAETRRSGGRANSFESSRYNGRRRGPRWSLPRYCPWRHWQGGPARLFGAWPMPGSFSTSTVCRDADQAVQPVRSTLRGAPTKPRGACLDDFALDLRHPRGGRFGAGREGKDVRRDNRRNRRSAPACSAPLPRSRSGNPAIRSAPIVASGRALRDRVDRRDRLRAAMAPLHPLQDQIVAGLQRQMEMRHQPRLAGDQFHQRIVDLDAVEARQAQPPERGQDRRAGAGTAARARPP